MRFAKEAIKDPAAAELKAAEAAPITVAETAENPVVAPTLHDMVIQTLRAQKGSLYAILDAARDPLILARLISAARRSTSRCTKASRATSLRRMPPTWSPCRAIGFPRLARPRWLGQELGCLPDLRQVVQGSPEAPSPLLDGRTGGVRRFTSASTTRGFSAVFLPTCTPQEVIQFLGPISKYVFEGAESAEVQIASMEQGGLCVVRRAFEPAHEAAVTDR